MKTAILRTFVKIKNNKSVQNGTKSLKSLKSKITKNNFNKVIKDIRGTKIKVSLF